MTELNRGKESPALYVQIARYLSEMIEAGQYASGEMIPSENQLQKQFGVSRVTVRLAINELVKRNYVECMRGIGTVVTYGKIRENIRHVISLTEEMARNGVYLTTSLCEMQRTRASEPVTSALHLAEGQPLYLLIRIRCVKNKPLVYTRTWLALDDLPTDGELYRDSLYIYLREQKDTHIVRGEDVLEAALPDATVARCLEISPSLPVFKRTRITYDQRDRAVEYSLCYYPSDRYKCSVEL